MFPFRTLIAFKKMEDPEDGVIACVRDDKALLLVIIDVIDATRHQQGSHAAEETEQQ